MAQTVINEITKETLKAHLDTMPVPKYYWPASFDFDYEIQLTYETIFASTGLDVTADVYAYDAPAELKTRPYLGKLTGDIHPIIISRRMDAKELKKYFILKQMIKTNNIKKKILDLAFSDPEFCYKGIGAKLELLCLKPLNCGKLKFTEENNAGIITENDIDFKLPAAHRRVLKTTETNRLWVNTSTAKPVDDIEAVMDAAEDLNKPEPRHILMNTKKFREFAATDQVKNYCMPWMHYSKVQGNVVSGSPSLKEVNSMLESRDLPTIIKIRSRVVHESKVDHTFTTIDPFTDLEGSARNVSFLPDMKVGKVKYTSPAEEDFPPEKVVQVKKGNVLISRWRDVNPVAEQTKGELYGFPSIEEIKNILILDTESKGTSGVAAAS